MVFQNDDGTILLVESAHGIESIFLIAFLSITSVDFKALISLAPLWEGLAVSIVAVTPSSSQ